MPDTYAYSHIHDTAIQAGAAADRAAINKCAKRITVVTEDSRETSFLFQRLSLALQRGNVVSFLGTFPTE